jgi:hypothetical protein
VLSVAVTVLAAIAAATGAFLAAPALLGRNLGILELALLVLSFGALGWGFNVSRRRRERKRMLGMRDSALW